MTTIPTDPKSARERLLARKAEIEELSRSSADSRRPVELDQQSVGRLSRVDALQMQAMAGATERHRMQQRARIAAALTRIETGDYGFCVACGEPIEPKRLESDPAVPTCIGCASRAA
ncbi:MAG: TraR/DksA C4-type zinc finger protein [Dongiaceae bacterium]